MHELVRSLIYSTEIYWCHTKFFNEKETRILDFKGPFAGDIAFTSLDR